MTNKSSFCSKKLADGLHETPQSKHIVIVIDCLDMVNGVSITYKELYTHWKQEHHKTHLHIYGTTATLPTINFEDEGKSYRTRKGLLKLPLLGYTGYFFTTPIIDFIKYIKEMKPDVIHVATPGAIGVLAIVIAKQRNCPVLYTHHTRPGVYVAGFSKLVRSLFAYFARTLLRHIMKVCDKVIVHSSSAKREAKQLGATSAELVKMGIRMPVELADEMMQKKSMYRKRLVQKYHFSENEIIFIFVGRLSHDKNIVSLIEFIEYMGGHILFVGDGPLRETIEKSTHARCTGFVDGEELSSYYYGADVLINLSYEETLGRTLLEALAHGTPLIVSNRGHHLSELPKDEGLVFFLECENMLQEEYVLLVKNYLQTIQRTKNHLAMTAFNYAKHYCWKEVIKQHADIYRMAR